MTDRTIPDLAPTTHFFNPRAERTNQGYLAQLLDEHGDPINPASVTSITLTLFDDVPLGTAIVPINGRNALEILNIPNGATVDANSWLRFSFQPADMVVTGNEESYLRRAHFRVTFSGGEINHEITFNVRNLGGVS